MNGHGDREALLARTFVELADSLVADFDVIEMLTLLATRTVELLDATAAGILLGDSRNRLRVIASSGEQVELLELFQLQNDEGPCLDCYRNGTVVCEPDLTAATPWPSFAAEAVGHGYLSVCAVPLRLREDVLGCLNLFIDRTGALADHDIALGQALADSASITVMQTRATIDASIRETNLQHALNSRVVIEQAKGVVAERESISFDEAFTLLREQARSTRRLLTDVCAEIVSLPAGNQATRQTSEPLDEPSA